MNLCKYVFIDIFKFFLRFSPAPSHSFFSLYLPPLPAPCSLSLLPLFHSPLPQVPVQDEGGASTLSARLMSILSQVPIILYPKYTLYTPLNTSKNPIYTLYTLYIHSMYTIYTSYIHLIMSILSQSLRGAGRGEEAAVGLQVSLLRLLAQWLHGCDTAVQAVMTSLANLFLFQVLTMTIIVLTMDNHQY